MDKEILPVQSSPSPLMTIPEASQMLRIGLTNLYKLISENALITVRIGKRRFVEKAEIERFIAERREGGIKC